MAETEHIGVATTTAGAGSTDPRGRSVELPVVELLTGRGFVTGKSGSGKSNTASVVAEKLLDSGFGMLIVDIDGEYYGLKEAYEILHVGADEECDIQVTVEHAEKIAALALEQNVPVILDVSSFIDESEAEEVLTEVARHLFAKAKKQKQPFMLLVEEIHEWIPEQGSTGEVGKVLIKIGKRGRKHGLGVVGISQRPADVQKDYITQCDWLVWHRLTWNNDTKVVGRILDSEYADAVEGLDDGEAFLQCDWSDDVRRVQFHRKQTFDAGATPGLDDFERPDLKSVSDDLVSELADITEAKEETEDRIAELREELDAKNSRIAELERELRDARDLSRMAEQFTDAMLDHVEGYNPGRTAKDEERARADRWSDEPAADDDGRGRDRPTSSDDGAATADATGDADATSGGGFGDAFGMFADDGPAMAGGNDGADGVSTNGTEPAGAASNGTASAQSGDQRGGSPSNPRTARNGDPSGQSTRDDDGDAPDDGTADFGFDPAAFANGDASNGDGGGGSAAASADGGGQFGPSDATAGGADPTGGADGVGVLDSLGGDRFERDEGAARSLREVRATLRESEPKTRRMLAYYVEQGPDTPLNAHSSAGGSDDRTAAYARNRELRLAGFVEHVGSGRYEARLKALVRDASPDHFGATDVADAVADLREMVRDL